MTAVIGHTIFVVFISSPFWALNISLMAMVLLVVFRPYGLFLRRFHSFPHGVVVRVLHNLKLVVVRVKEVRDYSTPRHLGWLKSEYDATVL
jgi:hypothetical protein